jgi:hypothetical protein
MPPSVTPWPAVLWAAAAHGELEIALSGERHDARDVRGVGDPDDGGRSPIDPAREDCPRVVVVGVLRADHPTLHLALKLRDRDGGALRRPRCHKEPL